MPNEIKKMTIRDKLESCYNILFKNKPISTLTLGVRVVECDKCEYNLKCDECVYKCVAEAKRKEYNNAE